MSCRCECREARIRALGAAQERLWIERREEAFDVPSALLDALVAKTVSFEGRNLPFILLDWFLWVGFVSYRFDLVAFAVLAFVEDCS